MAPAPTLPELVATIQSDAASTDALDQLAIAATTIAAIEEVSDSVLGYFVDQCRRSGRSWSEISGALGVTKQAAHKRFMPSTPALDRFTKRAQTALRSASEAATNLGHNYLGTEHLLLGLFEPAAGIAAQLLAEWRITRSAVIEEVGERVPRSPVRAASSTPPYTPRATRCLDRAHAEALSLGHNHIGTEHLLLALFDDGEGLAAKILGDLGADRDQARDRIIEKLSVIPKPSVTATTNTAR